MSSWEKSPSLHPRSALKLWQLLRDEGKQGSLPSTGRCLRILFPWRSGIVPVSHCRLSSCREAHSCPVASTELVQGAWAAPACSPCPSSHLHPKIQVGSPVRTKQTTCVIPDCNTERRMESWPVPHRHAESDLVHQKHQDGLAEGADAAHGPQEPVGYAPVGSKVQSCCCSTAGLGAARWVWVAVVLQLALLFLSAAGTVSVCPSVLSPFSRSGCSTRWLWEAGV